MRTDPIETTEKLEGLLLKEFFQCEEIIARDEDALLADLRYYQRVVHRQGLPSELRRLYRRHIRCIEMLLVGMADCLGAKPCAVPVLGS